MAKSRKPTITPAEQLDRKLEAVLQERDTALSDRNAELSALLRLAVELRDLPRGAFRKGLARAFRPPIEARDLREEARLLTERGHRTLGSVGHSTIVLSKFSGLAPWERHPGGDELIVVLEGGGEITVLTEDGPVRSELRPGRIFVCPQGLWHRPHAQPQMTALYLTPLGGGEHSFADDPRTEDRRTESP
jgi:mannose-6-phosphate isomerase-like protein (cupin superfamily)